MKSTFLEPIFAFYAVAFCVGTLHFKHYGSLPRAFFIGFIAGICAIGIWMLFKIQSDGRQNH
jgi:hypothetical protein